MTVSLRRDASGRYQLVAQRPRSVADTNRFLDALAIRGLSPQTVRAYGFDLVTFYRWLWRKGERVRSVRPEALLDYVASQRAARAQPASINRRLVTVGLFFRFVTGRDLEQGSHVHPLSPAPHYRGPGRDHRLGLHRFRRRSRLKLRVRSPHRIVEPLSADEVRRFLRRVPHYRDLAIVYLMLLCGLRSAEVVQLKVVDVLFDDGRLRITGKGGKERMLPLPALLARSLARYLEWERPIASTTPRLFVVRKGPHRGQPMTLAGLRSLFRHRRRDPTLARANPHRFRHTFGADMARAGVRLPLLQRMMGHADGTTTLKYIHLSMADISDEYRRAMRSIELRYRRREP